MDSGHMESGNGSSRRQKSPIPYVLPMACLAIALHGMLRLSLGGFEDGKERITARRQKRMHLYWGIRRQRTDKEGWKR